jgi:hypothetical protein
MHNSLLLLILFSENPITQVKIFMLNSLEITSKSYIVVIILVNL